jgi:hypothetical protein
MARDSVICWDIFMLARVGISRSRREGTFFGEKYTWHVYNTMSTRGRRRGIGIIDSLTYELFP